MRRACFEQMKLTKISVKSLSLEQIEVKLYTAISRCKMTNFKTSKTLKPGA